MFKLISFYQVFFISVMYSFSPSCKLTFEILVVLNFVTLYKNSWLVSHDLCLSVLRLSLLVCLENIYHIVGISQTNNKSQLFQSLILKLNEEYVRHILIMI